MTATIDGVSGSATLTVASGDAHAITVTLTPSTLTVGGTVRATATVYDALQQPVTGARVTWHSANPAVATVSDGGLVTALHAGSTVISASRHHRRCRDARGYSSVIAMNNALRPHQ